MGIFINIQSEIAVIEHYEGYELEIIKGANKAILNRNQEVYYLDLVSFALVMEIGSNKLLELISYIPAAGEYLAYYKNEQHKNISVLEFTGLDELIRGLRGLGYNIDLLKTIREQFYKLHEQIKEKESD
ncbi:hypothetical protein ABGT22_25380 [Peribacillus frigoritolerans]|uniref:hypothetical protein n=1 Tax=Peribacillus frigoritolerans TaxID=450367 RepID=UPI00345DD239